MSEHKKQRGCPQCKSGDHVLHRRPRVHGGADVDEVIVVRGRGAAQRGMYLWLGRLGVCVGLIDSPAVAHEIARAVITAHKQPRRSR